MIGCESKNDSENLFLYDISDIANIKRKQVLNRDKAKIFSVGWCLDGTRCFSISDKATNNFILWDFIDKEKLHPSSFDKQVPEVIKCSLSSDGKRLVVLELPSANIVLWDLNNIHEPVNKIISKEIEEKYPSSLMISYDGTKIITFNNGRHKFFIWNVFNLHAIVRNVLDRDGFMEMSQNLQGSFACITPSIQNEIIIGTPLNKAESKFLDEFNVLSFIQAKFIRMVMGGTTAKTGSLEHQIFISLPEVIQALLQANPEMYYDIVEEYIAKKK